MAIPEPHTKVATSMDDGIPWSKEIETRSGFEFVHRLSIKVPVFVELDLISSEVNMG